MHRTNESVWFQESVSVPLYCSKAYNFCTGTSFSMALCLSCSLFATNSKYYILHENEESYKYHEIEIYFFSLKVLWVSSSRNSQDQEGNKRSLKDFFFQLYRILSFFCWHNSISLFLCVLKKCITRENKKG